MAIHDAENRRWEAKRVDSQGHIILAYGRWEWIAEEAADKLLAAQEFYNTSLGEPHETQRTAGQVDRPIE